MAYAGTVSIDMPIDVLYMLAGAKSLTRNLLDSGARGESQSPN